MSAMTEGHHGSPTDTEKMRKEFAGPGMSVHLAATGTFLERQSPCQEETTWIELSLLIEESELVVKGLPVSSTKHLEGALYCSIQTSQKTGKE